MSELFQMIGLQLKRKLLIVIPEKKELNFLEDITQQNYFLLMILKKK